MMSPKINRNCEYVEIENGHIKITNKSSAIFGICTMYRGTTLVRLRGLGDLLLLVLDGLRSSFFSRSLILSSRRRFLSISSSSFLRSRGDLSLTLPTLLRLPAVFVFVVVVVNLSNTKLFFRI